MISRISKFTLAFLALITVLIVLLSVLIYLILKTPEGSLQALKFLGSQIGVHVEIGSSEGNMPDGLTLRKLRLHKSPFEVKISSLYIKSSPESIWTGSLSIEKLMMEGVVVHDRRPDEKKPPDLSWPYASGLIRSLRVRIAYLDIRQIRYHRLDDPPIHIDRIRGNPAWNAGILDLKNIRIDFPWGHLSGKLSAGFIKPFLNLNISLDLSNSRKNDTGKLSFTAALKKAASPEQVAGNVTLNFDDLGGKPTQFKGLLGMTENSFLLRDIRLKRRGLKGDLMGSATLTFPEGSPLFFIRANGSHLDLSSEIPYLTDFGGTVVLEGVPSNYGGSFSLTNAGKKWSSAEVRGSFTGNMEKLQFVLSEGRWLAGIIVGAVELEWKEGLSLQGVLDGFRLNPAILYPDLKGSLNIALRGELNQKTNAPFEGRVQSTIRRSQLLGKEIAGKADVRIHDEDIIITMLDVKGRTFAVRASGKLKNKIDFTASAGNLGELIPHAGGRLSAQGWVHLQDGLTAFSAAGMGENVSIGGFGIGSITYKLMLGAGKDQPLDIALRTTGVRYKEIKLHTASVRAKGTLSRHAISLKAEAQQQTMLAASFTGSFMSGVWQGTIENLSGKDKTGSWRLLSPVKMTLSARAASVSSLAILGSAGERLDLAADMAFQPLQGFLNLSWTGINLERISAWNPSASLSGKSSGNVEVRFAGEELKLLTGKFSASGRTIIEKRPVLFNRVEASFSWNKEGLIASAEGSLDVGGFRGFISSPSPVRFAFPERGKIEADVRDFDLSILQVWLPYDLEAMGRMTGNVSGNLLPDRSFELSGKFSILAGRADWRHKAGGINAEFRNITANISWRNADLRGEVHAELIDKGNLSASFRIPLPARLPLSLNRSGTLAASINGGLKEAGILNAAFPGFIEKSKGELNLAITVGGTWENPRADGRIEMAKAGAYLPTIGIELKDISIKARMAGNQILIDSLKAHSGPGNIDLQAVIALSGSQLAAYSGTVKGVRFQTVNLPELQLLTSPDLQFEGGKDRLTVRGNISVPKMTALGKQGKSPVTPSKDVIIIDAPPSKDMKFPLALDIRIFVILGDDVRVKADGASLRLAGTVSTVATSPENITAHGTVRIVEGSYSVYGVTLKVESGRIIFTGPADSPGLDITAVRKVEDVTAGILVGGTVFSPVIRLYSRPAMQEPDILSYLVLGHPLKEDEEDLSLLLSAAGSILTKSESASVVSQTLSRLGLEGLDIKLSREKTDVTGQSQTGAAAPLTEDTIVSIGKYLTPKLYVSYGRYLFSEQNVVKLRYKISKKWEVETHGGTVSGADIYYKIEFK